MTLADSGGRAHREIGRLAVVLLGVPAILCATASLAGAAEKTPADPAKGDAATFCVNVADAASDARVAWEAQTLNVLKAQIETMTADLEAKRADLQQWVDRRDAFRKLAEATIVDIYAKMRPEAAATQLASLDPEMAAAVLVKLNARTAGAILSEMDTPRAVSLAALISAGAKPEASQP